MALAMILEDEHDVPTALARWERECRALTDHVQWWSYLYGFVIAKVPERFDGMRGRVVPTCSNTLARSRTG